MSKTAAGIFSCPSQMQGHQVVPGVTEWGRDLPAAPGSAGEQGMNMRNSAGRPFAAGPFPEGRTNAPHG